MQSAEPTMAPGEVIEALKALMHLDIDAVFAYDQALPHVGHTAVRTRLLEFRHDHERHMASLSNLLRHFGAQPPAFERDLRGLVREGVTAVRAATGMAGAIRALRACEELNNRAYAEALGLNMPETCRAPLEVIFADEAKHRAFLQKTIDERTWEGPIARGTRLTM